MSIETVQKYLDQAYSMYLNNPYHNAYHAADVTQSIFYMLKYPGFKKFDYYTRISCIFAASIHDLVSINI